MQLSIGKLPEHHHFLLITRPFTDWAFKFVSWLIIAATIWVGGERTGNWYLLVTGGVLSLLPGAFIYAFFHWLSCLERPKGQERERPKRGWIGRAWDRTRQMAVIVASVVIWWTLTLVTQFAVNQTAVAILELQKSTLK